MTVFITPCLRARADRAWRGVLRAMCCFALAWLSVGAHAERDQITVSSASLKAGEEHWQLNANFSVRLNKAQEEALKKGLYLHFLTDFELERYRSWWLNDSLVNTSRAGRLSYNLLTRRYQLETGEQFKAFDTLPEVLLELGRLEAWNVAPKKLLKSGEIYVAALRMRLDQGQLPKPLQVGALSSGKWEIESDWHEWEIVP